jgi:hypothetical protein
MPASIPEGNAMRMLCRSRRIGLGAGIGAALLLFALFPAVAKTGGNGAKDGAAWLRLIVHIPARELAAGTLPEN